MTWTIQARSAGRVKIETLFAVSRALDVGPTWLLSERGSPVVVRRGADAEWIDTPRGRRRRLDDTVGTSASSRACP